MASSHKKPQKRKSAAADALVHVSVSDSSRGSGPAFGKSPSGVVKEYLLTEFAQSTFPQ